MEKKPLTADQLEHVGVSLITVKGTNTCLGDLMAFKGHGVFDPSFGMVPVSEEAAKIHNAALDKARLEGMDTNCEIGQGSFAYFQTGKGVTTFSGTVISTEYTVLNRVIRFRRAGKVYRGTLKRDSDDFNFRRVK